jgi:hypothetical protein
MKKLRIVGLMIVVNFIVLQAFGQDGMENLIKGSAADANYLIKGYTEPFINAFGSGLNQGWYNTAKTHKFPGVDLTVSVSLITVPTSDKTFAVDNSKMTELQLDGGNGNVPTMFGSSANTGLTYSLKDVPSEKFDVPAGVDLPIPKVPVPVVNLGIGLPKGFDLKLRYIPTIDLGGTGKLNLFGVGVMHDIKQYIPGVKALPFDLSVFVGYTKFKTTITLDDSDPNNIQTSNFNVSSTTIQALISKKLAVLTVYGGVGYDISKGNLALKGTYDIDGNSGSASLTDPIDFTSSSSSPRATAGLRLKLGPLTFHGDYTVKKYSAITAGVGLSVR